MFVCLCDWPRVSVLSVGSCGCVFCFACLSLRLVCLRVCWCVCVCFVRCLVCSREFVWWIACGRVCVVVC